MAAAQRGDMEMLQWLQLYGYTMDEAVCYSAALYGQLEVLRWAHAHGCPWSWHTRRGAELAVQAGRGDGAAVLAWVLANGGCPELLPCCSSTVAPGEMAWYLGPWIYE
jgi:hypothetical protein